MTVDDAAVFADEVLAAVENDSATAAEIMAAVPEPEKTPIAYMQREMVVVENLPMN